MRDASYAEWALGLGRIKMWKLKCFKFCLSRLLDLERVMKQEREPEETVRITRVEMSETWVEEMACEELKVVEEYKVAEGSLGGHRRGAGIEGGKVRGRSAGVDQTSRRDGGGARAGKTKEGGARQSNDECEKSKKWRRCGKEG